MPVKVEVIALEELVVVFIVEDAEVPLVTEMMVVVGDVVCEADEVMEVLAGALKVVVELLEVEAVEEVV